MSEPEYVPLPCAIHDELEAFSVRRETVRISFLDPGGAEREVAGVIVDIWAKAGAEYLRTEDGTTIRLDRLVGVRTLPQAQGA